MLRRKPQPTQAAKEAAIAWNLKTQLYSAIPIGNRVQITLSPEMTKVLADKLEVW